MGHHAYFIYLHRLYAGRPFKTLLLWLTAPDLYAAAIARTIWSAVYRWLGRTS
jgi:hypothetical protein